MRYIILNKLYLLCISVVHDEYVICVVCVRCVMCVRYVMPVVWDVCMYIYCMNWMNCLYYSKSCVVYVQYMMCVLYILNILCIISIVYIS